jgi:cell division protein YceG involved in septum cleavage
LEEIIKQLETPQNQDMQVTFLEGWNIYDMDEYLVNK